MKRLLLIILFFYGSISAQIDPWEIHGEMPIPVAGAEAVTSDGKIFILGGFSDSLQTTISIIQMFDPQTDEWQTVGQMLMPRMDFVADVYNNGISYFGHSESDTSGIPAPLEFWQFNTDGAQLTSGSTIRNNDNFGRTASTGLIHNNQFFILGGQPENAQATGVSSIIQYDIASSIVINGLNPENQAVTFPTHQMSEVVSRNIYVFGGVFNGVSRTIYRLNTEDFTYDLSGLQLIISRADGTAVKAFDGSIVLIGGFDESTSALREVERFYPIEVFGFENIQELPNLNIARSNCMAVSIGTEIYVFGGFDLGGSVVKEIEVISIGAITDVEDSDKIGNTIHLHQNYPNPFNPETRIKFELNENIHASLKIYSINGEEIKTIANEFLNAGFHEYLWDGTDNKGNSVSSGVYIYRLSGADYSQQKKMLLLR